MYRILEHLVFHPKIVVSKREEFEHLSNFTGNQHPDKVDSHLAHLRKKLRSVTNREAAVGRTRYRIFEREAQRTIDRSETAAWA